MKKNPTCLSFVCGLQTINENTKGGYNVKIY